MPDIRMPDGTIIRNVPEGTTKAQLQAKLSAMGGAPQGKADGSGSLLMAGNIQATPRKPSAAPVAKPRNQGTGSGLIDQTLSSVNEALIGIPQGIYNAASAVTDPVMGAIFGKDALASAKADRANAVDAVSRATVSRPSPYARTTGQIAGSMAIPLPQVSAGVKYAPAINRAIQGAVSGAAVRDPNSTGAEEAMIGAATNVALPIVGQWAMTKPTAAGARELRAIPQFIADQGRKYLGPVVNSVVNAGDNVAESALGYVKPRIGLEYTPLRPQLNPAAAQAGAAQLSAQRVPVAAASNRLRPPVPPVAAANADPLASLGPDAVRRAEEFKAAGVENPTTAMLTRDPRAWNFEQETRKLRGVGDNLNAQMQNVERQLVATGQKLTNGALSPEGTGIAVQRALADKSDEMQSVTSSLYRQVRETQGDLPAGEMTNFRAALENPDFLDNTTFSGMRQSLVNRLERLGLAGENMQRGNGITVSQAEGLRKFIRGLGDSKDPTTLTIRRDLINALDDDVVNTVGDDAFKAARASAKARFDEFSKTFAGKVADEGLAPELLTKRILGDGVSLKQLRSLRQSLTTGTPEQVARGQEAWTGIRSRALDDLISPTITPEGTISGAKLFANFGKAKDKLREILAPEEFSQLQKFVFAARNATAEVPRSFVNNSNTTSVLANLFDEAVKGGAGSPNWLKDGVKAVAKHGAAFAAGGPAANIGLLVGERLAAERAASREAQRLMQQVRMATNPAEAAAALQRLQALTRSNPSLAGLFQGGQNLSGNGALASGFAADLLTPEQQ